jgi:hypothetical protein
VSASQEIDDEDSDNKDSIASEGSRVMLTETTIETAVVTPSSPPPASANGSSDIALKETPPEKRRVARKPPDHYHVIICWLQLAKSIQENMVCSDCGRLW